VRAAGRLSLFTHMHFDIAYNQDRVIEVNVSTDAARTVRRRPALPRRPS
jgi:glutathione synthase/RimK-type ligase-like ATP-grasp enzyme